MLRHLGTVLAAPDVRAASMSGAWLTGCGGVRAPRHLLAEDIPGPWPIAAGTVGGENGGMARAPVCYNGIGY
ncbi:hypothetical protein [Bradyrhizobium genosp. P]|uniref:hypothetical protein n=1 Tax=Bradyrhizobium genosp. P TaxID=83641 RepID=UPI003CF94EE2